MKNLECYDAVMLAILREIHRRHAAAAELAIDRIGVGECGAQALDREGQGRYRNESGLAEPRDGGIAVKKPSRRVIHCRMGLPTRAMCPPWSHARARE